MYFRFNSTRFSFIKLIPIICCSSFAAVQFGAVVLLRPSACQYSLGRVVELMQYSPCVQELEAGSTEPGRRLHKDGASGLSKPVRPLEGRKVGC